MAGIGLWTSDNGMHPCEQAEAFLFRGQRAGGASFWAPLRGQRISSTRAEACAVLASLLMQQPLRLGFDNQGVVCRLRAICEGRLPGQKPWQLRRDGDVWQQVQRIAQQRGLTAATICK
eukprot:3053689-Alexandrium_andersonii.AAC.1